jgi:hypothetical protein
MRCTQEIMVVQLFETPRFERRFLQGYDATRRAQAIILAPGGGRPMKSMTVEELTALRDQHEPWLRSQPGVVGTGVGIDKSGRIGLKIYGNQVSADVRNAIHERLKDVPVAIEETGEIRKQ